MNSTPPLEKTGKIVSPSRWRTPSIQGRITALGSAIVLYALVVAGKVPLSIRQGFGRFIGKILALLLTRDREFAELQLKAFLPGCDAKQVSAKVFEGLAQTVIESLNLTPIIKNHAHSIVCRQPELLEWVLEQPRPILGLTAHTGNWELFAAYLNARGAKIVAIARPARINIFHEALVALRMRAGINVLWRAGRRGIREITEALRDNSIIGTLIDQDTRVSSIPVRFFGEPAQTPVTMIEIAKKHGAHIFSGFITREPSGTFALHIRRLNQQGTPLEILSEYHHALEEVIRSHPEQWVWFHKRWRTLPSGERRSSSDYREYLKRKIGHG